MTTRNQVSPLRLHWSLFKRVAVVSTNNMLIYRSNLIFLFLFESLFTFANIMGLKMGVDFAGGSLGGWSTTEVIFIAFLYQAGHQLFTTFCIAGLFHIGFFVWSGRMDYVLLKPLKPLIGMHAATEFIISNTPNVLLSFGFLIWSYLKLAVSRPEPLTAGAHVALLWLFILSLAVRYGIALLVVSPAYLAEKLAEGEDAYWSIQSLGKYPRRVFNPFLQTVFDYIIPLSTIAAIPAEALFGNLSTPNIVIFSLVGMLFFMVSLGFHRFCLSRYQSVNTGV
jgi:ABC-type uncharacterized transport system permease subunit